MNNNKNRKQKKAKMNMYAWSQKNKKVFAGVICVIVVLGMVASLLQM